MGILSELLDINRWNLRAADDLVVLSLQGQYQPDGGMSSEKTPLVSLQGTPGSASPSAQWVAGGARVKRIRSSWVSLNFLMDIRPQIEALRATVERDPTLGRAPLVTLTWGDEQITGFVTALRDTIPGLWVTGLPRSCEFEFEVTEVPQVSVKTGSVQTGETQWITLADGQTFEALGLRYYGAPLLGEFIRRENPALARDPEVAGARVKVLEREHRRARGTVYPTSPPFLDRTRQEATWQPVVEALAVTRGYTSGSLRWEQLPEVLDGQVAVLATE